MRYDRDWGEKWQFCGKRRALKKEAPDNYSARRARAPQKIKRKTEKKDFPASPSDFIASDRMHEWENNC